MTIEEKLRKVRTKTIEASEELASLCRDIEGSLTPRTKGAWAILDIQRQLKDVALRLENMARIYGGYKRT